MTGADRPGRIVVGVDGSPPSRAALRRAVRQAELAGASVLAVIAWSIPVVPGPVRMAQLAADWGEIARRTLEAALGAELGEAAAGVDTKVVEGRAATVLLDEARDADLLVVGSRGHGGFTGLLLGSVALQVTTHARCPVLVVHDPA